MVDVISYLTSLAVLALIIERSVEQFSGKIQEKNRKNLIFLIILVVGIIIVYVYGIGIIQNLFEINLEGLLLLGDALITGVFIAAGADPIHSVVRWMEEKKEQAKETTAAAKKNK
jgi:biotin transporter BioY